jgi:hypothetical protein
MSGSLSLADGPAMLSAGPFPAKLGTTLGLGDTERVTVPLDRGLPDGPWIVKLALATGLIHHAATATVTIPDAVGVGQPVTPGTGASRTLVIGLAGGLVAAAIMAFPFAYWMMRRGSAHG